MKSMRTEYYKVIVTGGGPAGLFCAWNLIKAGIPVLLLDRMQAPGKKFMLAGMSGGLNITHNCDIESFSENYFEHKDFFKTLLEDFSPAALIDWCKSLGVDTFQGNGGKIFTSVPAEDILSRWIEELQNSPLFQFRGGYEFSGFAGNKELLYNHEGENICIKADYAVFALGGGSRKNTGSDGKWVSVFEKAGIKVVPLKAANCGFETDWSPFFKEKLNNTSISLEMIFSLEGKKSKGEAVVTSYGLEGSGIYSLSHDIRNRLGHQGFCILNIDLLPNLSLEQIQKKLEKPKGKSSMSNYLRKTLKISGIKYLLLKELLPAEKFNFLPSYPSALKNLSVKLIKPRPLEEAISSAGGIHFDELDSNFMLKNLPECYVAGEMADWEAPTGGYLLQGCFSSAYRVAKTIIKKEKNLNC